MPTVLKFNITVADKSDADNIINALQNIGIIPEKDDDNETVSLDDAIAEIFPDNTPEEVSGMILKDAREEKGLTQEEFAKLIGTSRTAISAMESGKRPISKIMAKKFGTFFGIAYTAFL